jgi:hypothetical protein
MGEADSFDGLANSRFGTAAAAFTSKARNTGAIERPVIFLDIDGVLNRSRAETKDHDIDVDLLGRLKLLAMSTHAFIVLASTWRHEPGGLQLAQDHGIPFEDVLPDLRPHSRGREVRAWLTDHPGVERFAIIDDDDDDYGDMPLLQPNPYVGLSRDVCAAVEDFLSGRRDHDCRRSVVVRASEYLKSFFEGHRG